ncbi:MAG: hypothetical protein HY040_21590 [Planctomycetes bacterium]|nr:hypothetical protein [Planctomycetota bacterium]
MKDTVPRGVSTLGKCTSEYIQFFTSTSLSPILNMSHTPPDAERPPVSEPPGAERRAEADRHPEAARPANAERAPDAEQPPEAERPANSDRPPEGQRPPGVKIMQTLGLEPDPWQIDVLESDRQQLLLNCCRQAGKSTTVAVLALVEALFRPRTKVLIVSRSHRQAKELLRQIQFFHRLLKYTLLQRKTAEEIEFTHLSRIVSLPCREETIRGYSHIDLMILDEAARVPDDVYRAVRPMLAVSNGRLVCLSTPYGKRGFFWDAWARGADDWTRFEISADKIPRIKPAFLDQEKRALGETWFRQEYFCSFEAMEGLVYAEFERHVVNVEDAPAFLSLAPFDIGKHHGGTHNGGTHDDDREWKIKLGNWQRVHGDGLRLVGGIDFGFRNPFAAVWGVLDRDGVLWLCGEHYCRQRPLSYHAQQLPKNVTWHADPSGAGEISELRCAGLCVKTAKNAVRLGIAAVHARLEEGTLKILKGRCPNLLAEAGLYRFDSTSGEGGENPLDEYNHALDALRYLISRLDVRLMAGRLRDSQSSTTQETREQQRERSFAEMADDDSMWIP